MAKLFNSKRVIFPAGRQGKFINKILEKVSIEKAAKICGLSERTIRDWRREKLSVDLSALQKLCWRVNVPFPSNVKIKERYWYANKGAFAGWEAVVKKYGKIPVDPVYRKKKWYEWWKREGRYRKHPIINVSKPIKIPRFSKELAEFVGIVLGDGCISKYQITITLNSKDDKDYCVFVIGLINKLFNTPVSLYYSRKDSTVDIAISRVRLVNFCIKELGLRQGNKIKHQVDIPNWVKRNNAYSIACVRGLIDTDGTVFVHRYKVHGREYSYKKLSFTSRSRPLRRSVFKILRTIGLNARLAGQFDVRIDSQENMEKYFLLISSHNSKCLKKYKN